MKSRIKPEYLFWAGLISYVFSYDAGAIKKGWPTGSACWGVWLTTPKSRAACYVTWGWLTLHLFLKVPLPGQRILFRVLTGSVPDSRVQFHQYKTVLPYLQSAYLRRSSSSSLDPMPHMLCSTSEPS